LDHGNGLRWGFQEIGGLEALSFFASVGASPYADDDAA